MATPLELRSAGRPTQFSGKDEDWNDWSFIMRAYLSVIGEDVATMLESDVVGALTQLRLRIVQLANIVRSVILRTSLRYLRRP